MNSEQGGRGTESASQPVSQRQNERFSIALLACWVCFGATEKEISLCLVKTNMHLSSIASAMRMRAWHRRHITSKWQFILSGSRSPSIAIVLLALAHACPNIKQRSIKLCNARTYLRYVRTTPSMIQVRGSNIWIFY